MLSLFGILHSTSCVYPRVFISHRSDISFYYFSMFKICSSRHSFFILYTPFSSIVTHLFSNYTVRPRSKLLFHPCPLFSFFQACSDSSPSRLPIVIPSNRPLSIHFLSSFLRSSLSRASFSKSISIGFLFRSLVHDRRSPPASSPSSLFSILHESSSQFQFVFFSHFLFWFPSASLSDPSFFPSLSLSLCLCPFLSILSLSVSFSYTRRRLRLSPSRTAFLRCGTNRQSRAAGGTEKRRP